MKAQPQTQGRGAAWTHLIRYVTPALVCAAALPLGAGAIAWAWLAVVLVLLFVRSRCEARGLQTARGWLETLLGSAYAAAAFGLLETGDTAGEVLATTMLGVGMFATLVRDYRDTKRLLRNVVPYVGVVMLMQAVSIQTALEHHRPLLIATILAAPLLVGNIFMILHRDLVAAHRNLASALIQSEAAAHAKSEFLTTMSHEIRTPLNAVIGFAALLEASADLAERDASHVASIKVAGESLLGVVNDILDASSLEAGGVRLDPHPVTTAEFFRESLSLFAPLAAAN